jgi:hypothetical protein
MEESGDTYLRNPSLFDSYTRPVAKRKSPHSGFATLLSPRISHSLIEVQIMFEGLVQAFSASLMPSLWAAVLANAARGRQ